MQFYESYMYVRLFSYNVVITLSLQTDDIKMLNTVHDCIEPYL